MNWNNISKPPKKFGWYAGAKNPVNHKDLTDQQKNEWRKKFGFTKVWYNPMASVNKWWEPDPHGRNSRPIDDIITHWAELPPVPEL